MEPNKPRPPRSEIRATAEILDRNSGQTLTARTSNVNLAGCFVEAANPFPTYSVVSIKITHQGSTFTAYGDVIRSVPGLGMAIRFRSIDPAQATLLRNWLFSGR